MDQEAMLGTVSSPVWLRSVSRGAGPFRAGPAGIVLALCLVAGCSGDKDDDTDNTNDTDNGETGQFVRTGTPVVLGLTPFDTASSSSITAMQDEIVAWGAGGQFIQGAKWSIVCGQSSSFDADYASVTSQLAGPLERNMDLLYAMDFTLSADRSQLNRPEDCSVAADDFHFTNTAIADAYVDEVSHIAQAYSPKYFAISVEGDGFLGEASDEELEAYYAAYVRASEAIKAIRSDAVVFGYFQFEAVHVFENRWTEISELAELSDVYGFSSYPQALYGMGLFDDSSALDVDYYSPIADNLGTDKPWLFAELGATVATSDLYDPGVDPRADQDLFVRNLFAALEGIDVALVTWMFYYDLDFTAAGVYDDASSTFFSGMGLKASVTGPGADITDRPALNTFFELAEE